MPDAQSSRVRQYVARQQSLERLEFRPEQGQECQYYRGSIEVGE